MRIEMEVGDSRATPTSGNHKHAASCQNIACAVYSERNGSFDQVEYLYM